MHNTPELQLTQKIEFIIKSLKLYVRPIEVGCSLGVDVIPSNICRRRYSGLESRSNIADRSGLLLKMALRIENNDYNIATTFKISSFVNCSNSITDEELLSLNLDEFIKESVFTQRKSDNSASLIRASSRKKKPKAREGWREIDYLNNSTYTNFTSKCKNPIIFIKSNYNDKYKIRYLHKPKCVNSKLYFISAEAIRDVSFILKDVYTNDNEQLAFNYITRIMGIHQLLGFHNVIKFKQDLNFIGLLDNRICKILSHEAIVRLFAEELDPNTNNFSQDFIIRIRVVNKTIYEGF